MQNIGVRRGMKLRSVSLPTGVLEGSTEGVDHQFCNNFSTKLQHSQFGVRSSEECRCLLIQLSFRLLRVFTYRKCIDATFLNSKI